MNLDKLCAPLPDSEIEFRIGIAKPSAGFSLLAYKTARTDVRRLNDVFGSKWKNEFFYDSKNNLCCRISIYDDDIKGWVSRENVGTESMTEKEKGSYSDAMKRAGFMWGIGIELYSWPFVWVKWSDWAKNKRGILVPKANVGEWKKDGDKIVDKNGNVMATTSNSVEPFKGDEFKTVPQKLEEKKIKDEIRAMFIKENPNYPADSTPDAFVIDLLVWIESKTKKHYEVFPKKLEEIRLIKEALNGAKKIKSN